MSLISFLKEPDVKKRFRQEFKKPKLAKEKNQIAPPQSGRYSLIGTAFDYLLRFYLQCLNANAIRWRWVAEDAVNYLIKMKEEEIDPSTWLIQITERVSSIFSRAWIEHERYLSSGEITDSLLGSTLCLAQLDVVIRNPLVIHGGAFAETLGVVHPEDVRDLRNLISAVGSERFRAENICLLNPAFGEASGLVGGADADLLIDDVLIDIKTTMYFKLERAYFNQLIGYFILHEIAGIGDLEPKPKISKVAIYFSRYAHLETFKLSDVIDTKTFPDLVNWFSKRAEQYRQEICEGFYQHATRVTDINFLLNRLRS